MRFPLLISALSAVLVLQGCAAPQGAQEQLSACEDPRPQVCTMVYAPVCARTADGDWEPRSSACNACADDSVVGYRDTACPEDTAP